MDGVVWCRGCSFSFGEGLQYFSNLPSVVIPKVHEFDYFELRHSQYRFIQNNRYSKLLADKLSTIDVNTSSNGGTNNDIYNALFELYNTKNEAKQDRMAYQSETFVPLCDVDVIVIQFTNIFRDIIKLDGITYPLQNMAPTFDEYVEMFIKKNMTLEEFCERVAQQVLDKFKVLLQKIEVANPNIKIRVISWENDIDSVMRNDEYYKDKVVTFEYKDKIFKTLRDMIYSYSKLTIAETFYPMCKDDQHMNLEGHSLIAESIYKTI
jgi:hypothetical protein